MLRGAIKKYFVSAQVKDAFGGRYQINPGRILSGTTPPVAGYSAWYDGADATTIAVTGNDITSWSDKSGSDFTLTPTGTGPTYTNRTINGVTVPEWGGAGHMVSSCPTDDEHATWFFVGYADLLTAGKTLFGSSSSSALAYYLNPLGFESQFAAGYFDSSLSVTISTAFQTTLVVDAAVTNKIRLNGTEQTNSANFDFTAGRTLTLGSRGGTNYWDGLIAEVIYYNTPLTSGNITDIESYLKGKWNTP